MRLRRRWQWRSPSESAFPFGRQSFALSVVLLLLLAAVDVRALWPTRQSTFVCRRVCLCDIRRVLFWGAEIYTIN